MRGLNLLLLFLSFAVVFGNDYCPSSDIQNIRRQAFITKRHEHEIAQLKKIIQESTCDACHINGNTPCYNNGTCNVVSAYNHTCTCPDNTAGNNCETILSCDNDHSCGINAECFVANHKKGCKCLPGYSGDENVACTLRKKKASLVTDPHYTTFDRTIFDYMGTCPYYVMKACDPAVDFSIISSSYLLPGETIYKTYAKEMIFKTQGHTFKVDKDLRYSIDDETLQFDNYWPNSDDPKIIATKSNNVVTINDTVTNAIITFSQAATENPYALTVEVPLTPFFFGKNVMCGLFGSIDDNCFNDIASANGTIYETTNCTFPVGYVNATVASFADTWVINSTVDNCIEGAVIGNISNNCNITVAQHQCDLIRQAIDGLGPFAACYAMGHDTVDKYYHDCTFDICNSGSQCGSLDIFAKLCQQALPTASIDDWRTALSCPYTCPPNSRYSMKTPICQNSCSDPNYSNSSHCHEGYQEGCICDPGYYIEPNAERDGFSSVCLPLDECGCATGNGSYYLPNSHWLDPNCTVATQCYDGQLTSQPISCSTNGKCVLDGGNSTCQCDQGYTGDGMNCTDINECLDGTVCNANNHQGICNNLPGSYNCTCLAPFAGPECSEYLPSRHCADIQLFHGLNESGAYSVSLGANYNLRLTNEQLNWTSVYCDMESNGGGWTLMSHGNITNGKTYTDYINGFGNPEDQKAWLGLKNIHAMTQTPTSLRVLIENCPIDSKPVTDCTYDYFSVSDYTNQYAVFINSSCQSNTDTPADEGWITWDRTQLGPSFVNIDVNDVNGCSDMYYSTGWWYYNISRSNKCGYANLNGLHFNCGEDNSQYTGMYLSWGNKPVKDAHMYLRPRDYPKYDSRYTPLEF